MRSQLFLRCGLLLLLLALLLPAIDGAVGLADADELNTWKGHLFALGLGAFGLALLLGIVEKLGLRVSGARCHDCRKRIPHGHAYCFDHLMGRRERARELLRGQQCVGF